MRRPSTEFCHREDDLHVEALSGARVYRASFEPSIHAYTTKIQVNAIRAPPPEVRTKLKTDGSVCRDSSQARAGGVVQDANENWIKGF